MSALDDFLNKKIADDLGIKPEQVTTEFIHEMRKRMYRDPQHQWDHSTEFIRDPQVRYPTASEQKKWSEKCRAWAQEVLATGSTPCGFESGMR